MIKTIYLFLVLTVLIFLPGETSKSRNLDTQNSRFAKNHIIIKLKVEKSIIAASFPGENSSDENKIISIGLSLGIEIKSVKKLFPPSKIGYPVLYDKYELGTYYLVYFNTESDPLLISKKFNEHCNIDFSEPDFIGESAGNKDNIITPNDRYFNRQWGLYNDGNIRTSSGRQGKIGADMNVIKGWDVSNGSSSIIVAILDSGVKLDHPDLTGRIWTNSEEVKNGRDDDNNGYIDDINGYNFAYDNSNVKDDGGHGTNIAGTIGASANNEIGISGIDHNCKLMICKNLDEENLGEYSWWAASLYYAANNGASIINMSEGGYDYSKTLNNAIKFAYDAGCLIVASMMNKNNSDSYYPATFPEVMAIGATDTDDSRCKEFTWGGGSNWGKHIAVVAPGNRIYGLDYKDNTNYDVYWSGTSQATAYVSGIAAILLGQDNSRKNSELEDIINKTAVDRVGDPREDTEGWDQYYGYGRVDLYAALTYGNLPSGNNNEKKNEVKQNEKNGNEDKKFEHEDDKRAKAEDKYYKDAEDKDDKRARKEEHRDR